MYQVKIKTGIRKYKILLEISDLEQAIKLKDKLNKIYKTNKFFVENIGEEVIEKNNG